jgi:thiol:disulfide interchange protein DsbC
MRNVKWLATLVLGLVAGVVLAGSDPGQTIAEAIHKLVPNAKVESVAPAPIAGFSSAVVDGTVVYVSNDGRYLMQGSLYDLANRIDLSAKVLASMREKALATLPENMRITFPAQHPKYHVTVFTDVDCPYCRHFHSQITEYNKLGIGVDYVLFPLEGLHPQAMRKAQAVWCAKDRNTAYTAAMKGADPGNATCENPISHTLALGEKMGVHYTPTVLAPDGTEIPPGTAQSPEQLAALLAAQSGKGG